MTAVESSRNGFPVRHYPLAVSTTALALAWARQEQAPAGAMVVAEREVAPRGRLGRLWGVEAESTFACAVVTRPPLSAEEGDASWLLAGLAALRSAEAASGLDGALAWPESVVDRESGAEVAMVKADIHLRPGQVAAAVVTFRFDLRRLGLAGDERQELLDALLEATAAATADSETGGGGALAASYEPRCSLIGRRVKIALLPRGETRGTASRIDRHGRLEVASATGMTEAVTVDSVRTLEVLD